MSPRLLKPSGSSEAEREREREVRGGAASMEMGKGRGFWEELGEGLTGKWTGHVCKVEATVAVHVNRTCVALLRHMQSLFYVGQVLSHLS